jgi:hypothetical protein
MTFQEQDRQLISENPSRAATITAFPSKDGSIPLIP